MVTVKTLEGKTILKVDSENFRKRHPSARLQYIFKEDFVCFVKHYTNLFQLGKIYHAKGKCMTSMKPLIYNKFNEFLQVTYMSSHKNPYKSSYVTWTRVIFEIPRNLEVIEALGKQVQKTH